VTGVRPRRRRTGGESGSAVLEVLILIPVILAIIDIAVYAGQVRVAHSAVRAAAQEAARKASVSRKYSDSLNAETWARDVLVGQGLYCNPQSAVWSASPFQAFQAGGTGIPGYVTVTVTCQVAVNAIGLPGVGQLITITESASSPIDTYRWRSVS